MINLANIPNSLLGHITSFLPLNSAAYLSQVDKAIYAKITTHKDWIVPMIQNNWALSGLVNKDVVQILPDKIRSKVEAIQKVQKNGFELGLLFPEQTNDKDIVWEAIQKDPDAFQCAHSDLKKDREFVLKVVKHKGLLLQHVDPELKKDREVVLEAIDSSKGNAFIFVDPLLRKDEEIAEKFVKNKPGVAFLNICYELLKNEKFMLGVIKDNDHAFSSTDASLKNNLGFLFAAAKINPIILNDPVFQKREKTLFCIHLKTLAKIRERQKE